MDLDEIQSVQSRERQTDSLQQLRDSFYEEAGEFVRALRSERERAAERADDPFDAPEVNRLSDDIATAEQTLEAIYERRVGKIVKMASLAAADMPTEDEGLTTEERDLFDSLVQSIEDSREHVFDVLEGETVEGSPADAADKADTDNTDNAQPVPDDPSKRDDRSTDAGRAETTGSPEPETVSAADLMDPADGGTPAESAVEMPTETGEETPVPPEEEPIEASVSEPARRDGGRPAVEESVTEPAVPTTTESNETPEPGSAVDRTTVKITDDVGEILGVDDRAYDLTVDDVVTLPETNAGPLIEQGAAERLE